MQGQNYFSSYCRWMYERNIADELLIKFTIFSEILEPYYSLNKMAYFRTFVGNFRKWRHTWHYRTARHSQKVRIDAAESQIPSQSCFALINRHFMQAWREPQDGTREKIVSCVMSQLGARPWVCFWELSEKSAFVNFECKYLGKWVDFSIEISALFRICKMPYTMRWRTVVLALHFNFNFKVLPNLIFSC